MCQQQFQIKFIGKKHNNNNTKKSAKSIYRRNQLNLSKTQTTSTACAEIESIKLKSILQNAIRSFFLFLSFFPIFIFVCNNTVKINKQRHNICNTNVANIHTNMPICTYVHTYTVTVTETTTFNMRQNFVDTLAKAEIFMCSFSTPLECNQN